eukprot:jgi/Chlat1/1233/Chrsp115S00750
MATTMKLVAPAGLGLALPSSLSSVSRAPAALRGKAAAPAVFRNVAAQALFGSKKADNSKVTPAKSTKKVPAQTFKVTVPGVQSKNADGIPVTLGFTKANELFVGRLAMIGFASSLLGELLTGKGALAQFGLETGIPINEAEPLVLGLIGFNLIAAFFPASGDFVPEEDFSDRIPGALQDPKVSIASGKRFFGLTGGFGFTKENELFVGRVAQLGFAASLIGEAITGQGPLAQFDIETGLPLTETEPLLLAFIAFFLLAAINEGSGRFRNRNKEQ